MFGIAYGLSCILTKVWYRCAYLRISSFVGEKTQFKRYLGTALMLPPTRHLTSLSPGKSSLSLPLPIGLVPVEAIPLASALQSGSVMLARCHPGTLEVMCGDEEEETAALSQTGILLHN